MIYLVLAIICLILPWGKRYGILPLAIILLCLPVGNGFTIYFYQGGLFFFDFYFLSLFIRLVVEQRVAGKSAIFGSLLITIWAVIALASGVPIDLYFLRDFRQVIYLGTLICLISLQHRNTILTGKTLKWLAVLSGVSCLVYGIMTSMGVFQFEDEFYTRNSFRYFAVSSYFSFGFFAFSSFLPAEDRRGPLYLIALATSLLGIAMTGFRVMSFVALTLFMIGSMKSKRGIILSVSCLLLGTPLVLLTQAGGDEGPSALSRIRDLSPELVLYEIQNRFLPFFQEFAKFGPIEVWFGGGFGQTFEIPWFSHREMKDDINNFVDSTYLTLYAKFGIFTPVFLVIYAFSYSRLVQPHGKGVLLLVTLGLSMMWIVYSLPYQMTAIGLALPLFVIGSANRCSTHEVEHNPKA